MSLHGSVRISVCGACVCARVCVWVCVCVCVYIYIYIYVCVHVNNLKEALLICAAGAR